MPLFRAVGAVALVAASLFVSLPAQTAEPGRRLTPEQRRDMWERMTPEQRQQWRNARSAGQITPDERQAMRQRFHERQQNSQPPNSEQNVPPPRRQLSPAERQQLRQQIEQARRDIYRRGDGGNRRPNK